MQDEHTILLCHFLSLSRLSTGRNKDSAVWLCASESAVRGRGVIVYIGCSGGWRLHCGRRLDHREGGGAALTISFLHLL